METDNQKKDLASKIEALLFIYGEPLEIKKIASVLDAEENEIGAAVEELKAFYSGEKRGIGIISFDNRVQFATKPEVSGVVEKFIKDEFDENISPAALETLALVAYLGPLSRAKIDGYRGVNSTFTLRNLLMRGLIEKKSDALNSHVPLYQTSFDLLKHMGIEKLEDLPEYEKIKSLATENQS